MSKIDPHKYKTLNDKLGTIEELSNNSFIIYHNPRCSKSREALHILYDNSCKVTIVEYLVKTLGFFELKNIIKFLKLTPRDVIRKKEKLYIELKLDNPNLSDKDLIAIMVKHPILIERPIIVNGEKAVIGRPPIKVLELL